MSDCNISASPLIRRQHCRHWVHRGFYSISSYPIERGIESLILDANLSPFPLESVIASKLQSKEEVGTRARTRLPHWLSPNSACMDMADVL